MTLQEIFDRVLLESSQFIVRAENLEVKIDKFVVLVRSVLGKYSRYAPESRKFNINASVRTYTFTGDIPDWISNVVPVRIAGVPLWQLMDSFAYKFKKVEAPWEYRNPILYLPSPGIYDIVAVYKHAVVKDGNTSDLDSYNLSTIDDGADVFFKLLTGRFLQIVGRSRRAFTVEDFPITDDASELVSEGKEMEDEAKEELTEEFGDFYLSYGG